MVLKMAVNNSSLRCPIHEGITDGIRLWSWLKVRYESAAKLDPLRQLYGNKIRLLNLKSGGSLFEYIDHFQGLSIIWREINPSVEPKFRLVTQMIEHIEDLIFPGPCKNIKNWDCVKYKFSDAIDTLRAHKISKMTDQAKRAIDDEVNSLLLVNYLNNRRATGENKAFLRLIWADKKKRKIHKTVSLLGFERC